MRFLIDAQLPPGLADWIKDRGHDAEHVTASHDADAPDEVIWRSAVDGGFIVVSKDRDFVEWALARRPAAQVVWARIGNATNRSLLVKFAPLWPNLIEALETGAQVVEAGRL